jgi:Zn-finger nucleic acid-binding protein
MRCPRDQSELKTRVYEASVEVDECPSCSGRFLDKGELEAIQKAVEKAPSKAPPHTHVVPESTQALVDCPKCGVRMERRKYGLGSETVIDECPDGCGLWLDGGELEELEAFYEKSQGEVEIPLMWRLWVAVRGRSKKG